MKDYHGVKNVVTCRKQRLQTILQISVNQALTNLPFYSLRHARYAVVKEESLILGDGPLQGNTHAVDSDGAALLT